MTETEMEKIRRKAEQSPVVWLTVYQGAQTLGNDALAERARRELRKLGVIVGEPVPCK